METKKIKLCLIIILCLLFFAGVVAYIKLSQEDLSNNLDKNNIDNGTILAQDAISVCEKLSENDDCSFSINENTIEGVCVNTPKGIFRCVPENRNEPVQNISINSNSINNEITVSSGYTLFAPLNGQKAYLIDIDGNVVHEWSLSGNPGNSVYLLEDGNLLATYKVDSKYFDAGGIGGGIEILDWEGNKIWSYELANSDFHLHHDVEYLPDKNILMISWEKYTKEEALDAGVNEKYIVDNEVWSEAIFEINPNNNEIIWEWHAWDHLLTNNKNPSDYPNLIDPNYPIQRQSSDWLHINSIDYNEALDQIMISSHNTNEIWIIDHGISTSQATESKGDLLYRFGNNQAYSEKGEQLLYAQHDANWINPESSSSNILLFNNGNQKTRDYSTVVEINPNSYDSYGQGDIVWEYGEESSDENFFSDSISGAQRLENGNTLICSGAQGWFFEVTPNGETVWEYTNPFSKTSPNNKEINSVFRSVRYEDDYSGILI